MRRFGSLPGGIGRDSPVILERRVNDAPLVWVHRLERHAFLVFYHFSGDLPRKPHEGFLALGPVIFRVDQDAVMLILAAVYNQ